MSSEKLDDPSFPLFGLAGITRGKALNDRQSFGDTADWDDYLDVEEVLES